MVFTQVKICSIYQKKTLKNGVKLGQFCVEKLLGSPLICSEKLTRVERQRAQNRAAVRYR